MNIFIAEHEAECLKELKRQKDEYLKRLKSCRVRGLKEFKKVTKKRLKRLKSCRVRGQKKLKKVKKKTEKVES